MPMGDGCEGGEDQWMARPAGTERDGEEQTATEGTAGTHQVIGARVRSRCCRERSGQQSKPAVTRPSWQEWSESCREFCAAELRGRGNTETRDLFVLPLRPAETSGHAR